MIFFINKLRYKIKMEELIRDYSMLDAELMMFVSNIIQSMNRDATEFADYGVDAADITAFEALGNEFEVFPPDTYYQAEVGVATETKDAAREQLLTNTRKITNRAIVKWGEHSSHYKKFGVKGLYNMTDKSLLATSRLVVLTAADYLTELASEGLTQQIIDDYSSLAQQFENDLNAAYNAVENRDSKTSERILLGNNLYSYVSKYCRLGKTIWEKVDEAKYNDYVIYSAGTGGSTSNDPPAAPANLQYNESTGVFSWSTAAYATSYQLQYKAVTEADWDEAYSGSDTSAAFDPGAGDWNFRVRARNAAGYGDFSGTIEVSISAALVPPVNVQVTYDEVTQVMILTWLAVPGANSYKVYNSESTIGQPAGTWFYCFNPSGTTVNVVFTVGKRNWYRVTTVIGTEESEPSEEVYYDLPA